MKTNLDYKDAIKYFAIDFDTLEFLKSLTEDEKDNFNMCVKLDPKTEGVQYIYGHAFGNSEHLKQFGNGINNATWQDDDYEAVKEWATENNIEWDDE